MDRDRDSNLAGTVTASGDDEPTCDAERAEAAEGRAAPESKALDRGATLGRYIIVDTVGVGGTGIVYSAFDPDLDRKVALKLLRKSYGHAARARLLREAQAMAKLSHPNVVTVFEAGTDGKRDFVAMEFVDGQDLAGWNKSRRSEAEVLAVYQQAGEGLAAAHRAGLVHRDFKPQNVLIDRVGKVLVTDFGLARNEAGDEALGRPPSEGAPRKQTLTRTGALMGTPAYMAPEQHLAKEVDARSDQFSFCVALHEALCGERPYTADTYQELRAAVTAGEPSALPESIAVPASVRAAIAKGMSRAPEDRHASVEALLQSLTPTPRRMAPYALALLGLVAVIALLALRCSGSVAAPRCQFDRSMLAGAWDDSIRSKVQAAFVATGVEGASDVFLRLESIVDHYGADIVAMRIEVCESSRGRRGEADEVLVLQMSCLQRRRQDLTALASAFSSVDPRGVDRAIEVAQGLRPVGDCQDVEALLRGVPAPQPELREEVTELQNSLEQARLEGEAGHLKAAIVRAESANTRSLELDYLPLQAESYETLGHLYVMEVRLRDAEKAYTEAILAAEESGYTEYRARSLVGMTQLVAGGSSRYREARRLARRAKAAISQGGGDSDLMVDIDLSMANILMQEGELNDALALLEKRLRLYRTHDKAKVVYTARLQNRIASIRIEIGEYEEAHALAKSSYEQIRAELGDTHPRSAAYLSTLSITHRMRGELREARELDEELRAFWSSEKARDLLKEDDDYSDNVRSIDGEVLGPGGKPVEGAIVVCAQRIVADSHFLDAMWSARRDAIELYSRTETKADGSFRCTRASHEELVIVAEHALIGRSKGETIAESEHAVSGIHLTLTPTGFLRGRVIKDGGPAKAQAVSAVPLGGDVVRPQLAAVAFLRGDGSYNFERLAPGRYKVFSGPTSSSASQILHSKEVEIVAGRGAQLDFDQSEGDAALTIQVTGEGGAGVPSAQVLLVPGHIESQNGKAFNEEVVAGGIDVRSHFWNGGKPLELDELKIGAHSLCVVPLGGDYRDPEYMSKFTKEVLDRIPVHCQDIVLTSGETLEIEVAVPPLQSTVELEHTTADSE
ncbi:MAG: serine/threonine protein kinase [Myxococcales bacterium]|nr:serine/threonine protein kinase [Myxococcales bacterium]